MVTASRATAACLGHCLHHVGSSRRPAVAPASKSGSSAAAPSFRHVTFAAANAVARPCARSTPPRTEKPEELIAQHHSTGSPNSQSHPACTAEADRSGQPSIPAGTRLPGDRGRPATHHGLRYQPAYHSMINRRSVPALHRACQHLKATGKNRRIPRPEPLKRSTGLHRPGWSHCRPLTPERRGASVLGDSGYCYYIGSEFLGSPLSRSRSNDDT